MNFDSAAWNKTARRWPLAALISILAACGDAGEPSYSLEKANEYAGSGDLGTAVIELKHLLKQNPDDAEARLRLGEFLLRNDDPRGAEKELERALELGIKRERVVPSLAQSYLSQGLHKEIAEKFSADEFPPGDRRWAHFMVIWAKAQVGRGDKAGARKTYLNILEHAPGNVGALNELASLAIDRRDMAEARSYLETALREDPENARGWYLSARIHHLEVRYEDAAKAYQRSLAGNPDQIQPRVGLAQVRLDQGQIELAEEAATEVLAKRPRHIHARFVLAASDFHRKEYRLAEAKLQKILRDNSRFMPAVLLLGAVHYAQGHLSQADLYLTRFTRANPDHILGRVLLADVQVRTGREAKARTTLGDLVTRYPKFQGLLKQVVDSSLPSGFDTVMLHQLASSSMPSATPENVESPTLLTQGGATAESPSPAAPIDQGANPDEQELMSLISRGKADEALRRGAELIEAHPDRPGLHNLQGTAHAAKRDMAAARKHFEKAIEVAPGDRAARFNLAVLDMAEGNLDGAKQRYEELLEQRPNDERVMQQLALVAKLRKDTVEQIHWLNQIREANPAAIRPRIDLARIHLLQEQPEQCLEVLREAYRLEPENPTVLSYMAEASIALEDYEQAEDYLGQLTQSDPTRVKAWVRLARVQQARGQLDAMEASLKRVVKLDPGHVQASRALVELSLQREQPEQALDYAESRRNARPEAAESYALLGRALYASKQYPEALDAYQEAYLKASSGELARDLYRAAVAAGRPDVGRTTLEQWLAEHPDDILGRLQLAQAYFQNDDRTAALDQYRKLLDYEEDNLIALNNLAALWIEEGAPDKAIGYAEKAFQVAPRNPAVADTLGWLLAEQGRNRKAIRLLKKAAEGLPDQPEILYHVAVVESRLGRTEDARENLRRALDAKAPFPSRPEARQLLDSLTATGPT